MLVLTRKNGQSIKIGDDIVIKIMGASCGRASVCIDAPRDVRVVRSELENKPDGTEGEAS